MMLDPAIVIAVVGVAGSALAGWLALRREERTAKIVAKSDSIKVSAEFDVKREELLTAGIEAHFNRLERQISLAQTRLTEATERIDRLTARVDQLESERERMIQWMAFNRLGWPPPEDSPI